MARILESGRVSARGSRVTTGGTGNGFLLPVAQAKGFMVMPFPPVLRAPAIPWGGTGATHGSMAKHFLCFMQVGYQTSCATAPGNNSGPPKPFRATRGISSNYCLTAELKYRPVFSICAAQHLLGKLPGQGVPSLLAQGFARTNLLNSVGIVVGFSFIAFRTTSWI